MARWGPLKQGGPCGCWSDLSETNLGRPAASNVRLRALAGGELRHTRVGRHFSTMCRADSASAGQLKSNWNTWKRGLEVWSKAKTWKPLLARAEAKWQLPAKNSTHKRLSMLVGLGAGRRWNLLDRWLSGSDALRSLFATLLDWAPAATSPLHAKMLPLDTWLSLVRATMLEIKIIATRWTTNGRVKAFATTFAGLLAFAFGAVRVSLRGALASGAVGRTGCAGIRPRTRKKMEGDLRSISNFGKELVQWLFVVFVRSWWCLRAQRAETGQVQSQGDEEGNGTIEVHRWLGRLGAAWTKSWAPPSPGWGRLCLWHAILLESQGLALRIDVEDCSEWLWIQTWRSTGQWAHAKVLIHLRCAGQPSALSASQCGLVVQVVANVLLIQLHWKSSVQLAL